MPCEMERRRRKWAKRNDAGRMRQARGTNCRISFSGVTGRPRKAGGFTLARKLVTDIPKDEEPSERDKTLIADIIRRLAYDVQHDFPDVQESGAWRNGVKPRDGLSPPFPDAAVLARIDRCVVIGVRVDPNPPEGAIRIDDMLMADIMGRH
jgi:hypothetical protein